jgi:hypothetical protein
LQIISFISDCGEFGGHSEVFKVFKSDKVMIIYHRGGRYCFPEPSFLPKNLVMDDTSAIGIDKQKLITAYLKILQDSKHSKDNFFAPSYAIRFNNRVLRIQDADASGVEYEKFRDALIVR